MALSYGLWLGIIALQSLLLVRLRLAALVGRYPFFFLHAALIWISTMARWVSYHQWSFPYPWVYWLSEILMIVSGFLVVWEIFRQTFLFFPTLRYGASWILLVLVVLVLLANLLLMASDAVWWDHPLLRVERWVRLLQAGFLAAIMAAVSYYSLPLGRNIAGMAMGFGLFVSLSVVNFVSEALGYIDLDQFTLLYEGVSLVALLVWCFALWVYAPNPVPTRATNLEQDYARVHAALSSAVVQVRVGVRKALGA